ncbi:unnamed protein product [Caenorhabditis sp. 36 PRJEB53466]|nr:unnamed protein product [Caenorhabditis sp. 36 PRJEB53466]
MSGRYGRGRPSVRESSVMPSEVSHKYDAYIEARRNYLEQSESEEDENRMVSNPISVFRARNQQDKKSKKAVVSTSSEEQQPPQPTTMVLIPTVTVQATPKEVEIPKEPEANPSGSAVQEIHVEGPKEEEEELKPEPHIDEQPACSVCTKVKEFVKPLYENVKSKCQNTVERLLDPSLHTTIRTEFLQYLPCFAFAVAVFFVGITFISAFKVLSNPIQQEPTFFCRTFSRPFAPLFDALCAPEPYVFADELPKVMGGLVDEILLNIVQFYRTVLKGFTVFGTLFTAIWHGLSENVFFGFHELGENMGENISYLLRFIVQFFQQIIYLFFSSLATIAGTVAGTPDLALFCVTKFPICGQAKREPPPAFRSHCRRLLSLKFESRTTIFGHFNQLFRTRTKSKIPHLFSVVPKDWTKFAPLGDVIPRTRFVVFKTPINSPLSTRIEKEQRFTTSDLFRKIGERGQYLGLVVDLTDTDRYYDKEDITGLCIQYEKVNCPGRGFIERDECVESFNQAIQEYTDKCEDKEALIGVHCTNGINRCGYLICRFLIERLGWSSHEAIDAFEQARGYSIEKGAYVMALHKAAKDSRNKRADSDSDSSERRRKKKNKRKHREEDNIHMINAILGELGQQTATVSGTYHASPNGIATPETGPPQPQQQHWGFAIKRSKYSQLNQPAPITGAGTPPESKEGNTPQEDEEIEEEYEGMEEEIEVEPGKGQSSSFQGVMHVLQSAKRPDRSRFKVRRCHVEEDDVENDLEGKCGHGPGSWGGLHQRKFGNRIGFLAGRKIRRGRYQQGTRPSFGRRVGKSQIFSENSERSDDYQIELGECSRGIVLQCLRGVRILSLHKK